MKPSALVLINFKYGTNSKPLKAVAYSQLIAKALLIANKLQSEKQIAQKICEILGIQNVSQDLVSSGLAILLREKVVEKVESKKWRLTKSAQTKFDLDVKTLEASQQEILDNNFPSNIDSKKLSIWFSNASAAFFGHFSQEWVTSVAQGNKLRFPGEMSAFELLSPSIDEAGLSDHKQALVKGYLEYLQSTKPSDQESLMSMGLAMFSAQLVSADLGADPVGLAELKDASFFLDTNILIAIALNDEKIATSLRALSKAFITINAKLLYTPQTRDEYLGLVRSKKASVLKITENYDEKALEIFDDDFYKAALKSGCKTQDDFVRFFEQLEEAPASIGGEVKINLLEDNVTEELAELAIRDERLKATIQNAYKRRPHRADRPDIKPEPALEHDAVLIRAVEQGRKETGKCWALSMDRSLHLAALDIVGANEVPAIMAFDTFIEILALDTMGPGYDPANFAPLLANMLLKKALPHKDAFHVQDFQWLSNIISTAGELPPVEVEKLLNIVKQHRLRGSSSDDESLRLKINRAFQSSSKEISDQLDDANRRAKAAEVENKTNKDKLKALERALEDINRSTTLKELKRSLINDLFIRVVGCLIFAAISFFIFKNTPAVEIYGFGLAMFLFVISSSSFITGPIKSYIREKNKIVAKNKR